MLKKDNTKNVQEDVNINKDWIIKIRERLDHYASELRIDAERVAIDQFSRAGYGYSSAKRSWLMKGGMETIQKIYEIINSEKIDHYRKNQLMELLKELKKKAEQVKLNFDDVI